MKSLIILFADNFSNYGFENSFDGENAFNKTLAWAKSVKTASKIEVFCFESNKDSVKKYAESGIDLKVKPQWTNETMFAEISDSLSRTDCDYALFTFAFNPFMNLKLTENLIATHEKFRSEYSFADGFPLSVSPEILDKGLVKILSELIKGKEELKNSPVTKSSVYDLIKTDINSFEIETEISEIDWRLYRFDFSCDKKENYLACTELYEKVKSLDQDDKYNIQKIAELASKDVKVLKTIPAYFNIQISNEYRSNSPYCAYSKFADGKSEKMAFDKFKVLIKKINDFNPDAVISLSLWGDPLLYPEFFEAVNEIIKYEGLTVLVETDGFDLSKKNVLSDAEYSKCLKSLSETVSKMSKRKNGYSPLIWIVNVDAMTQATYEKIHPGLSLNDAVESVKVLQSLFAGNVYAQHLRTTDNEEELESFYRSYKEKDFISGGNFIIQKYDHFCKKMPEVKSADLSPIERLPCWHLRRDFNVLSNGEVAACRDKSFETTYGNAFTEELSEIWKKTDSILQNDIEKKYCEGCDCCDEFYTYNF